MEQQIKAPQDIRIVVNFLRNSKVGMHIRVGTFNGKRIDYFKVASAPLSFVPAPPHLPRSSPCASPLTRLASPAGKGAIKALTLPVYAKLKNVPKVTTEEEATNLLLTVIPFAFFLRVERGMPSGTSANSPKALQITQMQTFVASDYYAWFYEGSQWTTYLGGVAMVAVMLAGVMFPLWPPIMRLGVWYLSIGVLGLIGLFFALAIVRLIFYIITVIVASPGIWIFPKLFADVGFVRHSFLFFFD